MSKELKFSDFPPSWEYCFNDQCTLHESCIHRLSASVLPEDRVSATCVLPAAAAMTPCPFYKETRICTMAWGFKNLFKNVRYNDSRSLHVRLHEICGSQTSYYRYMRGEYKLTPEQQEEVIKLFNSYGYYDDLTFDHYEELYDI